MTKADKYFKETLNKIMKDGVYSHQARPKYSDGRTANSKYLIGQCFEYDISKNEFPIIALRPIAWKSAIKEILWIYQMQSNKLDDLRNLGVKYWDSWDIGDGTIGQRYGYTVRKHKIIDRLLKQLEENPYNRRNVINLWDYESFDETDGLCPCAFLTMFDVRNVDGEMYLDCTLVQRSGDFITASSINTIQYVALQMMIAKHFGWKVGKFIYFVNNIHIYDNQYEIAEELLKRESIEQTPILKLNVPDKTNFYDINPEDFELIDYQPVLPQLKFELAI